MPFIRSATILFLLYFSCFSTAQSNDRSLDLALVLAVDVSGSISPSMKDKQQAAFAEAFRTDDLWRAMLSGPRGRVAVAYFEYSGADYQRVVVPWIVLSGKNDLHHFANMLDASRPTGTGGETSISGAMFFAADLLRTGGFKADKLVVDIAGNGRNSDGPPVEVALRHLRAMGVTVNGLVSPNRATYDRGPYHAMFFGYDVPVVDYYRREVIGGPGSFAVVVDSSVGLVDATLRKLVTEVAWAN